MKRDFDFYEFVGILVPGMLLLTGLVTIFWCGYDNIKKFADMTVGGLGIGLVLAYAAGHLVQGIGNIIEQGWWTLLGGNPSDWVRLRKRDLIADSQLQLLQGRVRKLVQNNTIEINATLNTKQWYSITRQIYSAIEAAGRSKRVDVFNGNYGLCRGLAAGLLFILLASVSVSWEFTRFDLILAALFCIAIYRMHRFGVHYGRELFVQFLQLPVSEEGRS